MRYAEGINVPHTTAYCGSHIYEDGTIKQRLFDGGYLTYKNSTPVYHFYVKDHLGNNRMVLSESTAMEQVTHYYPYGLPFASSTYRIDLVRRYMVNYEFTKTKWYIYGLKLNIYYNITNNYTT